MPTGSKNKDVRVDDVIVAFMGPTGSGKSFFIDLLTRRLSQRAKNSLESVTQNIETTRMPYPDDDKGRNIVFVDTPGFDDHARSDMQILTLIGDWLRATYENKVKLSGLIYLHSIRDNRMAGTPYKNLRMFGELCGDVAMSQVALVTTMWQRIDKTVGEAREQELRGDFWKAFIDKGSSVDRLQDATSPEAWRVVETLLDKQQSKIVLLQEELVDKKIALNETHAGQALYTDLQKKLRAQKERMKLLIAQLAESNSDPELKEMLQREYDGLERDFNKTFEETKTLKLSLLRRLFPFLKKKTEANGIGLPQEWQ